MQKEVFRVNFEVPILKVNRIGYGYLLENGKYRIKGVNGIYHLDWSPDGKNLVFGGYTGGGPELRIMENFMPLVKR